MSFVFPFDKASGEGTYSYPINRFVEKYESFDQVGLYFWGREWAAFVNEKALGGFRRTGSRGVRKVRRSTLLYVFKNIYRFSHITPFFNRVCLCYLLPVRKKKRCHLLVLARMAGYQVLSFLKTKRTGKIIHFSKRKGKKQMKRKKRG